LLHRLARKYKPPTYPTLQEAPYPSKVHDDDRNGQQQQEALESVPVAPSKDGSSIGYDKPMASVKEQVIDDIIMPEPSTEPEKEEELPRQNISIPFLVEQLPSPSSPPQPPSGPPPLIRKRGNTAPAQSSPNVCLCRAFGPEAHAPHPKVAKANSTPNRVPRPRDSSSDSSSSDDDVALVAPRSAHSKKPAWAHSHSFDDLEHSNGTNSCCLSQRRLTRHCRSR
jgi:hypothetical protein